MFSFKGLRLFFAVSDQERVQGREEGNLKYLAKRERERERVMV